MAQHAITSEPVRTNIPARLDRLPWTRWHWLIVFALGITWILDGLEVTIVGAIADVLNDRATLNLSPGQIGLAASAYLAGAILGALFFGYLTDRLGRRRLFLLTLVLYLLATVATAFSWSFWSFAAFRFLTGAGIGGEYAAINSAIDELIPARVRGWVDLAINGSWWVGTLVGAVATLFLLNPKLVPVQVGWRLAFGLGAVIGLGVLLVRRFVPESPRWLMTHGKLDEAERVVRAIEEENRRDAGLRELPEAKGEITIRPRERVGFLEIARTMMRDHRQRSILGLILMASQAIMYNAIFFTYALVLKTFYHVPAGTVGKFLIPFAIGNILGPLSIGRLFDTLGRRVMITFTYAISGILLAITAYLFTQGTLTATTQTLAWTAIFFFASAGASSAYLTVSEIFPLETRAMAIAFFYAVGTALAIPAPGIFGAMVGTRSATTVALGYYVGAAFMLLAATVELLLGVDAERKSLEEVAKPLSAEVAPQPV
ncbi:MAG TPA: MFS transporter [Candidatus Limnocylindrales bacterium]|nr:MFS transporter [Candidatus Limnocylindrales bacterium]